ncbi:hypothetical protein CMR41_003177 [Escherichia coli]|nr:hypothetical protein [Escherichia coli]
MKLFLEQLTAIMVSGETSVPLLAKASSHGWLSRTSGHTPVTGCWRSVLPCCPS